MIRFTPTGVGTADGCDRNDRGAIGSPPRAWGRLSRSSKHRAASRFTPTGVGTALITKQISPSLKGSPPRAWGRRLGVRYDVHSEPVHPHGRGDGWL